MKVEFNIDKKIIAAIVVVIIVIIVAAYIGGYIGKPVYGSEREASEAIIDIGGSVEQIGSIIEDLDRRLGR